MEDPEGGPQERYVACGLALGRPCTVLRWAVKHLGLRGGAPTSLNLHTATPKKNQPGSGKQSFAITNTGTLNTMQ